MFIEREIERDMVKVRNNDDDNYLKKLIMILKNGVIQIV